MSDPRPIGVFDSGVGGLTVLREVIRRSPHESTIYLGDNARAPYGVRPDDEVLAFSTQSLDALVERDVKALVVACNTSTAVGLAAFRRRYDLPVLGVIRPGASAAALATRNRRVGVIATPATIRSHAYFKAIKDENPAVEVYEHATPDLVPLVEAGELCGPTAEATVAASLAALLGERDADGESIFPRPPGATIDTLLLGCTHYPLLRPLIAAHRRRAGRDRRFRDGHRVRPGRAARASTAWRPATRTAPRTAPPMPAHDRRRRPLRALAGRLFGTDFPDVESVELGVAGRMTRRERGAVVARRPGVAGRGPHRLGARGRGDGRRPADGADRARGPRRLAGRRALRDRPAGAAPGTLSADELRAAEPAYAEAMARIVPALSSALGTELPGVVERSGVVDRAGWVRANTASFASLIGKLEKDLLDQVVPPGGGLAKATMALANRWITTRQLGLLLGFLGQRVLGQYDIALLSAEAAPGRLLFVEENIRETARVAGRAGRAVPDLDRPARDDPRVRVRGASLAAALPRVAPRAPAHAVRQRCPRDGPRGHARPGTRAARRGRRRALDGAAHGRRAARACSARRRPS